MMTYDNDQATVELVLSRGSAAARAGFVSVASKYFEQAAELAPDNPNVWRWLAWVANSPENTIRCLERLLELDPDNLAAGAGLSWTRSFLSDLSDTNSASSTPLSSVDLIATPVEVAADSNSLPSTAVASESDWPDCPIEASSIPVTVEASAKLGPETPESIVVPQAVAVMQDASSADVNPSAAELQAEAQPEFSSQEPPRRRWDDLVKRAAQLPLPETSVAAAHAAVDEVSKPIDETPRGSLDTQTLARSASEVEGTDNVHEESPSFGIRVHSETASNPPTGVDAEHTQAENESAELPPTEAVGSAIDLNHATDAHADVEALSESFAPATDAVASDGRPLIMVVDDSPTVRKLVSLTLERRGYRVISAFDGVAAIKELGSCRPDLILLDINMPRLDGYRLCKLIKKHEATQSIPVVMLSGKDGMFDKLRGRLVGCSDYITKPFEADALTHKVAKYLSVTPASTL